MQLVEVLGKGNKKLDTGIKGKLLSLLRAFPPSEPTKKKYVAEMIAWSAQVGDFPNGDPELHHVAGTLFAEGVFSLGPSLTGAWLAYCIETKTR